MIDYGLKVTIIKYCNIDNIIDKIVNKLYRLINTHFF